MAPDMICQIKHDFSTGLQDDFEHDFQDEFNIAPLSPDVDPPDLTISTMSIVVTAHAIFPDPVFFSPKTSFPFPSSSSYRYHCD